jgi:hypothetical protein
VKGAAGGGLSFRVAGAAALLSLGLASPSQALGLRAHLYTAEQVYADLAPDCRLGLAGQSAAVPADVCAAIRDNKGAFLAGALGPDVFPDLLVGQTFVHPGTPEGLQSADWLEIVLAEAKTGPEIAYAYGQMLHASGDVFAHSYVNNYAGGVFEITQKRAKDVELRHFKLEKYIDQRLDYDAPLDTLVVPADLLVRTMVKTSYLPQNVTVRVEEIDAILGNPAKAGAAIVAGKLGSAAPAAHMTTLYAVLSISKRSLSEAACGEATELRAMTGAYWSYIEAEAAARGAARPAGGLAADDPALSCEARLARGETTFQDALHAGETLATAERPLHDLGAWRRLPRDQRRALKRGFEDYAAAADRRARYRAVRIIGPAWASDVETAARAYMLASLRSGKVMVRNSEPVPPPPHEQRSAMFPYKAWRDCYLDVIRGGPAAAGEATCERLDSLQTDIGLTRATAYAGLGRGPQGVAFAILDLSERIDDFVFDAALGTSKTVAPDIGGLVEAIAKPQRITREELNATFRTARSGQLEFQCVADWIDADLGLMAPPPGNGRRDDAACLEGEAARREAERFDPKEVALFRHVVTLGKLSLLDRAGVQDLANALACGAPNADCPSARLTMGDAFRYSILLDAARSLDGSQQWQGQSMPEPRKRGLRTNVEIRSAGYPERQRSGTVTLRLDKRIKARPGFPYYRTEALRGDVFTRLFPDPFEGEILRRREYEPDLYPFASCKNDPFRPARETPGVVRLCQVDGDAPAAADADEALATRLLDEVFRAVIGACLGQAPGTSALPRSLPRPAGCLKPIGGV